MKPVEVKRDDGVELETQVILRLPEVREQRHFNYKTKK